jgi:hypothetical protein
VTQANSGDAHADDTPFVFMPEIMTDNCIGDRGIRKWQSSGKFPPPDGNLNGRNFWRRSTYRKWQIDVLAGRYRRVCNLSRKSRTAGT